MNVVVEDDHVKEELIKKIAKEVDKHIPQPKEPKLSRLEIRKQERLREDVEHTYNTLTTRFLDYFTQSDDPEGQDVQNKLKQISAQWRMYCKRKGLIPSLYPIVDKYMDSLLKEYEDSKHSTPVSQAAATDTPQG